MTIEVATYISELDPLFPEFNTGVVDGDDHLRLVKNVLQNTIPNANAAILASVAEFAHLIGVDGTNIVDLVNNINPWNIGPPTAGHMAFDQNSIQAKLNATTEATLSIQQFGGLLNLGAQAGTGNTNVYADGGIRAAFNAAGVSVTGIVSASGDISGVNVSATVNLSGVDVIASGNVSGVDFTATGNVSGVNFSPSGTVDGRDVAADGTKLDGVEALADVTDTANVTSAGALMDSEVDANIKTLVLPASTTISAFAQSFLDDLDAAAVRTTIGAGTGDGDITNVTAGNGLSGGGGSGSISLAADFSEFTSMGATAPNGGDEFVFMDGGAERKYSINDMAIPSADDSGVHTFIAADVNEVRWYTGTGGHNWTMNSGIGNNNSCILVINDGTGDGPDLTNGTANFESASGNLTVKQDGMVLLVRRSSTLWKASGDLV